MGFWKYNRGFIWVCTMIGNLAGAVTNIYFCHAPAKNSFIGTSAYVFFLINLFKVPFHIWVWKTIQINSFQTSMQFLPFLLVGLVTGVRLVKRIKEVHYRKMILFLTALGAIILLVK